MQTISSSHLYKDILAWKHQYTIVTFHQDEDLGREMDDNMSGRWFAFII